MMVSNKIMKKILENPRRILEELFSRQLMHKEKFSYLYSALITLTGATSKHSILGFLREVMFSIMDYVARGNLKALNIRIPQGSNV